MCKFRAVSRQQTADRYEQNASQPPADRRPLQADRRQPADRYKQNASRRKQTERSRSTKNRNRQNTR